MQNYVTTLLHTCYGISQAKYSPTTAAILRLHVHYLVGGVLLAMLELMIDSHCHLDHCQDPDAAADASLQAIVSIGTTLERCQQTLRLAERYEHVWAAVGIHPTEAEDAQNPALRDAIAALAQHPKVVAIGETGLDYYWDKSSRPAQRESFRWQAALARAQDKPLILHVRDKQNQEEASLESMVLLQEAAWHKGILHCFNGHQGLLETGLALGWHVSFAGNLTYKSAQDLQRAALQVPDERLLIETDSPFLSPVPKRGQRNLPAYVRYTAAKLADLRGVSLEHIEACTDANARRVYGLPQAVQHTS